MAVSTVETPITKGTLKKWVKHHTGMSLKFEDSIWSKALDALRRQMDGARLDPEDKNATTMREWATVAPTPLKMRLSIWDLTGFGLGTKEIEKWTRLAIPVRKLMDYDAPERVLRDPDSAENIAYSTALQLFLMRFPDTDSGGHDDLVMRMYLFRGLARNLGAGDTISPDGLQEMVRSLADSAIHAEPGPTSWKLMTKLSQAAKDGVKLSELHSFLQRLLVGISYKDAMQTQGIPDSWIAEWGVGER